MEAADDQKLANGGGGAVPWGGRASPSLRWEKKGAVHHHAETPCYHNTLQDDLEVAAASSLSTVRTFSVKPLQLCHWVNGTQTDAKQLKLAVITVDF